MSLGNSDHLLPSQGNHIDEMLRQSLKAGAHPLHTEHYISMQLRSREPSCWA
jgi:hypothetical protein